MSFIKHVENQTQMAIFVALVYGLARFVALRMGRDTIIITYSDYYFYFTMFVLLSSLFLYLKDKYIV